MSSLSAPLRQLQEFPLSDSSLDQLQNFLSQSEARNVRGKMRVTSGKYTVTLEKLCERACKLSENRSQWTQSDEENYAKIAARVRDLHEECFQESVSGGPCCFSWIARDPVLFSCCLACCSCPPLAVLKTMNQS